MTVRRKRNKKGRLMKLSYNWVKEYIDLSLSAEELAEGLTMAGSEVDCIEEVGGDKVLEFEITTNRPDCLNVIGLAREASAVFDKDIKLPETNLSEDKVDAKGRTVKCDIKNKELCPRYTARVISGVKVSPASRKIASHITSVGMRAVNNIVDVTNYCLMESGQPMHAFDLDKIDGDKIIIREAKKGEKIVTIDDEERELDAGMLVIADKSGPIAVAGVMGGKSTEVTGSTENILLESAYFDPVSVRRTARKLGLSSDSSYRFERGVDKANITIASDRAAALIIEEAGGSASPMVDEGKLAAEKTEIDLDITWAGKVLGVELEEAQVKKILTRLGCEISSASGAIMKVKAPTFREDLKADIDLVEEIGRIYGYDNIPMTISRFVPSAERKSKERLVLEKIKDLLASSGLNEIMTYSLINEEAADRFNNISGEKVVLSNYISAEHNCLTPHLMDGMLKSISYNLNRQNLDLGFFEIGKLYRRAKKGKGFEEAPALCIGLSGAFRRNWQEGERPASLFDLRGIVETALERIGVEVKVKPLEVKGYDNAVNVSIKGVSEPVGLGASVGKKILKAYDITSPVLICQIDLTKVLDEASLGRHYHSIPKFPFSSRDVSILCDQNVVAGELQEGITSSGEELIRSIELVDAYRGERIPEDKVSYTYTIQYGLATRTLKDEEIEAVHERIKKNLSETFKVSFR